MIGTPGLAAGRNGKSSPPPASQGCRAQGPVADLRLAMYRPIARATIVS